MQALGWPVCTEHGCLQVSRLLSGHKASPGRAVPPGPRRSEPHRYRKPKASLNKGRGSVGGQESRVWSLLSQPWEVTGKPWVCTEILSKVGVCLQRPRSCTQSGRLAEPKGGRGRGMCVCAPVNGAVGTHGFLGELWVILHITQLERGKVGSTWLLRTGDCEDSSGPGSGCGRNWPSLWCESRSLMGGWGPHLSSGISH